MLIPAHPAGRRTTAVISNTLSNRLPPTGRLTSGLFFSRTQNRLWTKTPPLPKPYKRVSASLKSLWPTWSCTGYGSAWASSAAGAAMCDDQDDDIPAAFFVEEHRTDEDRARMRQAYRALADKIAKEDPELGAELHRILDGSACITRQ